jgi:hypothetical protein
MRAPVKPLVRLVGWIQQVDATPPNMNPPPEVVSMTQGKRVEPFCGAAD